MGELWYIDEEFSLSYNLRGICSVLTVMFITEQGVLPTFIPLDIDVLNGYLVILRKEKMQGRVKQD